MSKNGPRDMLSTDPYKGVRDFYPEDQALLNYIIATWRSVAERMGYVEYGASILEPSELYKQKGVENEELVNEQTYTFLDRGDREVTLRPEMTPTVARMVAAKRRELGYPLRWYSVPNCFRYERPQRGRLREFWQFNADIFGSHSLAADVEIIQFAYEMVRAFGGSSNDFVIKVGSRAALNKAMDSAGFSDAQKKGFLTLIDRKSKMPAAEFEKKLQEFGVTEALVWGQVPANVLELQKTLSQLGVTNVQYDPSIVRGFAYYTDIMFEVFDTHPDNNRALMGGGRYDNLTTLFDSEPLPGVGFAIGDATMKDFLDVRGLLPQYLPPTKAYIALASAEVAPRAMEVAQELRKQGVAVAVDFGERKLGDQIKTADRHKIPWLIVVGQNELDSGSFTVKNLESGAEEKLSRTQLAQFFLNL